MSLKTARTIDALLDLVAVEYRKLPKSSSLALHMREAYGRAGLPGGYSRRDVVARPLSESLKGRQHA